MISEKTLLKFKRTPGLCTRNEVLEAKEFFVAFDEMLELYGKVAYNPFGATIKCELDTVAYYENRSK